MHEMSMSFYEKIDMNLSSVELAKSVVMVDNLYILAHNEFTKPEENERRNKKKRNKKKKKKKKKKILSKVCRCE